eukprot:g59960.t1
MGPPVYHSNFVRNILKISTKTVNEKCEVPEAVIAFNNELNILSQRKKLSEAKLLFAKMRARGEWNDVSYGVMLNAYVRCGYVEEASELLEEMEQEKIVQPNVIVFTTLSKGLCDSGRLAEAFALLDKMEKRRLRPNLRTYNTLLRGCVMSGDLNRARQAFARLRANTTVKPDVSTRDMMMTLLCQGLKLDDAISLLNHPKYTGLGDTGGALVAAAQAAAVLQKWKQAQQLLKKADKALQTQSATGDDGGSGGRRSKRTPEASRDRSAAVFSEHRRTELQRTVSAIHAFVSSRHTRPPEDMEVLQHYGRLLSFPSQPVTNDHEKAGQLLRQQLLDALRNNFGLDVLLENMGDGAAGRRWLEKRFKHIISPNKARLRLAHIFDNQLPVKLEICAGRGEWALAQAMQDATRANWVTLELRKDRAYYTWAQALLAGVSNLCVLAGEALTVTRQHLKANAVQHVFINHPEPPQQVGGQASEARHLLTPDFFSAVHTVLAPGGHLSLVTDNLFYGRLLLRSFATQLAESFASVELSCALEANVHQTLNGFVLYEGQPGPHIGHSIKASSYFDRLWVLDARIPRYFLFLRKLEQPASASQQGSQ